MRATCRTGHRLPVRILNNAVGNTRTAADEDFHGIGNLTFDIESGVKHAYRTLQHIAM
jgi:hypothetical protein